MNLEELANELNIQPKVLELGPNLKGRDYFTGDICGHYTQLCKAMEKVDFTPSDDRLFTTGNLFDYGIQGPQILELLDESWFYSVLGIQELIIRGALESGNYLHWHTSGGEWAFDNNMQPVIDKQTMFNNLKILPIGISVAHKKYGKLGILSASPGRLDSWDDLEQLRHADLLNCLSDEKFPSRKMTPLSGLDTLIVGNKPAMEPWARNITVGINLGARYLPERGQMKLWKTKRLRKVIENKVVYKPLIG